MSIFKARPWWSNETLQEEIQAGVQNGNCLQVNRFSIHSDGDCITIGEGTLLKIYKPCGEEAASQVLLEIEMADFVVQILNGKFTTGVENSQILVLHPHSFVIYDFQRKQGHTEAGEQSILSYNLKHTFARKAYSAMCGPFGKIKSRDLICVQATDSSLSFYDQNIFLFLCQLDNTLLPCPIGYIASSDSFAISKSTWMLEVYSYQQLKNLSEQSPQRNKKVIPQWCYNIGEEICSMQIIQSSTNFSSIIALGERYLYCFQDNGFVKFVKKLDYSPMCFHAYLIGWYYEPGSRLLVMVASEDAGLYIYEGTTLLWSCGLTYTPIAISRFFTKTLSGGLVSLSSKGIITISYLGTAPDLNPVAAQIVNDNVNLDQVQAELDNVEESLQKIMQNNEGLGDTEKTLTDMIKIKVDSGQLVQDLNQQYKDENTTELTLLKAPIIVILSCEDPKLIESVQITYFCCLPFVTSDTAICLDGVNGTEIIETQVFIANQADISDTKMRVHFTITDSNGKIVVISKHVFLPTSLYYSLGDVVIENPIRLEIQTNKSCVDLVDLFADFLKEDLLTHGNSPDTLTFVCRGNNTRINLRALNTKYFIETEEWSQVVPILENLIFKLEEYHTRMDSPNFRVKILFDKNIQTQLTHGFLKSIEIHAKERLKLKSTERELYVLQKQFILVQKRLLVQYGSSPPGDCEQLEFLMRDTYDRITRTVKNIIKIRENVSRAGCTMASMGKLITLLIKNSTHDHTKVKLIEEMISLNSIYEDYQDWEESVIHGLSYIMKIIFKKSEKDKEKLAAVNEQGVLSNINLKRFLKQLKMVIDAMFAEAGESREELTQDNVSKIKPNITRIEEFVEII